MKHRKMLYQLEKEREKFGSEASNANAKFAAALEEVSRRRAFANCVRKLSATSHAAYPG